MSLMPFHIFPTSKKSHEVVLGHIKWVKLLQVSNLLKTTWKLQDPSIQPKGVYTSSRRPFQHHLAWLHSSDSQTGAPSDSKAGDLVSQNRAHCWSQNITKRLYIKFQTIPTSFGPKCKSRILLDTMSALPSTIASETSSLQSEPMDGLKILPWGSMPNFRSTWHRLT